MLDNISKDEHGLCTLIFFYRRSNTSHVIDMLSQIGENYQTATGHPPWKNSTKVENQSYELKKTLTTTLTYFSCSLEEFPAHFRPTTNGRVRIFNIGNILRSNCHGDATPFRIDLQTCDLKMNQIPSLPSVTPDL